VRGGDEPTRKPASPTRSRLRARLIGRTQSTHAIARTLARDTGIGYGVIRDAVRTTPASPAKLTYEIGVLRAKTAPDPFSLPADAILLRC
jgi:hypothetical protein